VVVQVSDTSVIDKVAGLPFFTAAPEEGGAKKNTPAAKKNLSSSKPPTTPSFPESFLRKPIVF